MGSKKLELVKAEGRFTLRLIREGWPPRILMSDEGGATFGGDWWVEELRSQLTRSGCSDAQIIRTYQKLFAGPHVQFSIDLPARDG